MLNSFQFKKILVSTKLVMRQVNFLFSGIGKQDSYPNREFLIALYNICALSARWRQHTALAVLQLLSLASTEWVNHLVHIGGRFEYGGNVYLSTLPGCDFQDWFPVTGVVQCPVSFLGRSNREETSVTKDTISAHRQIFHYSNCLYF